MKFDRKASGWGLEIVTRLENGKAYLECVPRLEETENAVMLKACLEIDIWDGEGKIIFRCQYPLGQERPIKGIVLHPKLWQGGENAYLYQVRAILREQEGRMVDVLDRKLALRSVGQVPMKGWCLNGTPLEVRAVAYELPMPDKAANPKEVLEDEQIRRDLALVKEMGANGIYSIGVTDLRMLGELCDETGLLLWNHYIKQEEHRAGFPIFYGTAESLLSLGERVCTDHYYYYKACWSREPFVYISMNSLKLQEGGSAGVVVYSNQKRVALYVDGILFEFRNEGPDFVFEEIPIKQLPILLTADTGECSMSVTVYPLHKTFTK